MENIKNGNIINLLYWVCPNCKSVRAIWHVLCISLVSTSDILLKVLTNYYLKIIIIKILPLLLYTVKDKFI